jgi:DNA-binding CsgD family transcriptional regulator
MEQLTDALEGIRRGEVYFSPTASKSLRQIVRRRKYANLDHNDLVALRLVAQQQPIKHIAYELGLSLSGAYKLVDRLLAKTGSANTAQLLHQAVLLGLVTPE